MYRWPSRLTRIIYRFILNKYKLPSHLVVQLGVVVRCSIMLDVVRENQNHLQSFPKCIQLFSDDIILLLSSRIDRGKLGMA